MVVTCGDCGARFRLDPALLKDSSAARLRCRKCGGLIVVRLHEESPAPVLPPQETIPPSTVEPAAPAQKPGLPWPVEPIAPAQEPTAFESDISGVVGSGPVPPPPDEKAVPPDYVNIEPEPAAPLAATGLTSSVPHAAPAAEPEPAQPGTIYSRVEALFSFPPGEDARTDRIPPPPEEFPAGESPREQTAAAESRRKVPPRRAPFMLKVLVISVLWILLLAGGALYFGTTKQGQETMGRLFAGWGSSRTGSVPARPVYDIRGVKWYFDKDSAAGDLFVIKGSVA